MEKQSYIEFHLVDPRMLSEHSLNPAIVMTIGTLYEGDYLYRDKKNPRADARAVNSLLKIVSHYKTRLGALRRRKDLGAAFQIYYCSLCGGKLSAKRCTRCKVKFTLNELYAISSIHGPNIPPKIVEYATSQGHRFAQKPPRP